MNRPSVRALRTPLLALMIAAALPAMAQTPPKVQVQSFKVSGNTLLPAEQIDAVLARYTGERSLDELKQAALAVQALYRAAGYGAVVTRPYPPRATVLAALADPRACVQVEAVAHRGGGDATVLEARER